MPFFGADTFLAVFDLPAFFWRLPVFRFEAVLLLAAPGTSKFAGTFLAVQKDVGIFSAVPGTLKFAGTFLAVQQYASIFPAVPSTSKFAGTFLAVLKYAATSPAFKQYGGNVPKTQALTICCDAGLCSFGARSKKGEPNRSSALLGPLVWHS